MTIRQSAIALTLSLGMIFGVSLPSLAGDPFRQTDARNIGTKTAAAFEEIFKKGNYTQAKVYLLEATKGEKVDPLTYAMLASMAYTDKDWDNLKVYATQTREAAEALKSQDPLRYNIYLGVGKFLEGTYIFKTDGPVSALPLLQQVFQAVEKAEAIAPNDPELNLIKGFFDLMLAVNLPFSSPQDAIARFESYAAPDYLVKRGIALAYRDLKNYQKALEFIDQAIATTPDNPELEYLKGQILRSMGKKEKNVSTLKQALEYYNRVLPKQEQLPQPVQVALRYEHRKIQGEISELEGKPAAQSLKP
jgi:tetratricopeptide (TPR) repeat protein